MPNSYQNTITKTQAKILFVDDEPRILRSFKATFKSKYIVYTAENAISAQAILAKQSPIDVIVADERMPQITGHQLLQWSKENFPASTRILLSGIANKSALDDKVAKDIFDFVRKPWDFNSFEKILDKGVEASKDAVQKNIDHLPFSSISQTNKKTLQSSITRPPVTKIISRPKPSKGSTHCGFAIIGCSDEEQHAYRLMIKKIDCLSSVTFSHSSQKFINTVIDSPDIGVVCIDLSIGYSETKRLFDLFQKQKRKYQILLTTDIARAKRCLLIKDYLHEEHFIIKPASLSQLQSKISFSINAYIQDNSDHLNNNK